MPKKFSSLDIPTSAPIMLNDTNPMASLNINTLNLLGFVFCAIFENFANSITLMTISEDLGVNSKTLYNWIRVYKQKNNIPIAHREYATSISKK